MSFETPSLFARALRFLRVLILKPSERAYLRAVRRSGMFDAVYYRGAYPGLNVLYRWIPLHHYIAFGESMGFRPNPDFSPFAYLRYNPDVAATALCPGRAKGSPHHQGTARKRGAARYRPAAAAL